jgi:hypothetical protein
MSSTSTHYDNRIYLQGIGDWRTPSLVNFVKNQTKAKLDVRPPPPHV